MHAKEWKQRDGLLKIYDVLISLLSETRSSLGLSNYALEYPALNKDTLGWARMGKTQDMSKSGAAPETREKEAPAFE